MATTQEVLDSTKVLQERVKQEGVTINSETMQGQDPITLPETPTPTPVPPPTPTPPQETDGYNKTIMDYINSSSENKPTSGQDIYSNLYNQSGITGLQEKANVANNAVTQEQANLDAINARLNAIVSSAQQANLQLESGASGKDVTSTFLGRQQQEVARQAGIQALPLQAQALASQATIQSLQGNAQAAQTLVDQAKEQINTLFQIQSTDAINQYNYRQKLIDSVYSYAEKQDQKKLDEAKTKNEQEFILQRDELARQHDIAMKKIESSNVSGLTTAQINSTINQIVGSFDNEQTVKDYNQATSQYQLMNSLGTKTSSPGDDIAFVYSFAKLMDPNSVVREGEYATIQKYAQSMLDAKTLEAIRLAKNTNFLTSDAKQKLLTTAMAKMKVLQTQYSSLANQYEQRISNVQSGGYNTIPDYSAGFPTLNTETESGLNTIAQESGLENNQSKIKEPLLNKFLNWAFGKQQ
jgi:hypothetical protein